MIYKGQKVKKNIGHIRIVCEFCKNKIIRAARAEEVQWFDLLSGHKLNCNYCSKNANWIKLPENVKLNVL